MYYKAIDRWNSPSLAHYGVKGMKWGVRHDRLRNAAARTGRVVRVAGGAVKKSASTIAKGIWRAGSAVRRFKNRRAIKSADVNRILKRANKMNNQELSDALTRVQLKNQISNQNRGGNSRSLGETVANSLKDKAANMAANALNTSVDSLLRGELPTTGLIRNAQAQRALQEKQISENKMNKITNNYKIDNSYLQNKMNVSAFNAQIAKNNLAAEKDRQSLRDLNKTDVSSIKHTVTLSTGRRIVQRSLNSSNSYLYAPLSDTTRYKYEPKINLYQTRIAHSDMKVSDLDNYLAHYGVKGMKWGIRKVKETITGIRPKAIEKSNRFSKDRIMYGSSVDDTNKIWNAKKITPHHEFAGDIISYRDSNRDSYMDDVSYGRAVLRRLVLGKTKSQNYNKLRAAGNSRRMSRSLMNRSTSDIADMEISDIRQRVIESKQAYAAIKAYEPKHWTSRDPWEIGYDKAFEKGAGFKYKDTWKSKYGGWKNKYLTMK